LWNVTFVVPRLDPGIHAAPFRINLKRVRSVAAWITGSSPVMTLLSSTIPGQKARRTALEQVEP
jgi:hypothetical protein